jgi:hypothetical protein
MAKSAIDAEFKNSIFRKDFPMVIALRRDLAQLSPVRLKSDGNDYIAGQVLARKVSDGEFYRWSAVSGLAASAVDTNCVLFETVITSNFDSTVTGGTLARALMSAYVYKSKLIDYVAGSSLGSGAKEQTDATGITVVKF